MNIPAHLVAIVIALVAFVYGVKVILRARKHLKYWDEFSKDGELVKFVSKRGLKKSTFRREKKKEPSCSMYFGVACVAFSIFVILAALGNLFF